VPELFQLIICGKCVDEPVAIRDRVAVPGGPGQSAADSHRVAADIERGRDLGAVEQAGIDPSELELCVVEIETEIDEMAGCEAVMRELDGRDVAQAVLVEIVDVRRRDVGIPDQELVGIVAERDVASRIPGQLLRFRCRGG
jgi:hypothetical protein